MKTLLRLSALLVVFTFIAGPRARAEDWGAYALVPASAPRLVLEAVNAGTGEGTPVSIGKPAGMANQKWTITQRTDGTCALHPASSSALVLTVAKGELKSGAALALESDRGEPGQSWTLTRLENGSYLLTPKSAPELALDDFGGNGNPGAKIDLWALRRDDQHEQWLIQSVAGTAAAPVAAPAEPATYVAPEIAPEAIRPGTIKQFSFTQSAIFPGTVRDVTVFIPAQYDAAKPACVYVKTDGYNAREKVLMETMIATKEMPVTVGVFVRPGELPAAMPGTLGRRNRCFEYDGVGDENVRFLTEELLPFVAREYSLNLSTDGNDRCISGGSSGGIAAFTAAWLRPEAFSRVYAASGSFVAFRGGNEYPTLVRKFEPKPIRAFLTTGTHDMENAAGNWFLLDQEMDKALKFSGYDYVFRAIEGGHVVGYMDNYREALAYLWKGWPERVRAGAGAPRVQDVLLPGEGWQPVAEGFHGLCAAAANARGEVFIADLPSEKILHLGADGKPQEFVTGSGSANGLTVTADGRLCTCSATTGRVMSYDEAGKGTVLAEKVPAHSILALPDGAFYLTGGGEKSGESGAVSWLKEGRATRVATGLRAATGLALRPDGWLLSVADGRSKWAWSGQTHPDGTLTNQERFFHLHVDDWEDDAGAEAVCYAREGQMFVATRSGLQVCADDGPVQVILPLPDHRATTAVCLGGPEGDTLYACSAEKIWKRHVKVHAFGAFSPWTKVVGTKL